MVEVENTNHLKYHITCPSCGSTLSYVESDVGRYYTGQCLVNYNDWTLSKELQCYITCPSCASVIKLRTEMES